MKLRVAVLALGLLTLASCGLLGGGPGTPGYGVTITNGSRDVVTFYAQGVGESANSAVAVGVRLAPQASFVDHWLTPNAGSGNQRATVRATNATGVIVFCRQLSWSDLKLMEYRIVVDVAYNACA